MKSILSPKLFTSLIAILFLGLNISAQSTKEEPASFSASDLKQINSKPTEVPYIPGEHTSVGFTAESTITCTESFNEVRSVHNGSGSFSSVHPFGGAGSVILIDDLSLSAGPGPFPSIIHNISSVAADGFYYRAGTVVATDSFILTVYADNGTNAPGAVVFRESFGALDVAGGENPVLCPTKESNLVGGDYFFSVHLLASTATSRPWAWVTSATEGGAELFFIDPFGDFGNSPGTIAPASPLGSGRISALFNFTSCTSPYEPVPTVSEWGLFFLGLLLLCVVNVFIFRKKGTMVLLGE